MKPVDRIMRIIEKKTPRKSEKGVVFAVDGDRIDVRLRSSSSIIRNIEVSGQISSTEIGDVVTLIWVNDRPYGLLETSETVTQVREFDVADMTTTQAETMALKIKDYLQPVSYSKDISVPSGDMEGKSTSFAVINHNHNTSFVTGEDLSWQVITQEMTFQIANPFVPGSIRLYYNGLRQKQSAFTEDLANNRIIFSSMVFAGEELVADYIMSE